MLLLFFLLSHSVTNPYVFVWVCFKIHFKGSLHNLTWPIEGIGDDWEPWKDAMSLFSKQFLDLQSVWLLGQRHNATVLSATCGVTKFATTTNAAARLRATKTFQRLNHCASPKWKVITNYYNSQMQIYSLFSIKKKKRPDVAFVCSFHYRVHNAEGQLLGFQQNDISRQTPHQNQHFPQNNAVVYVNVSPFLCFQSSPAPSKSWTDFSPWTWRAWGIVLCLVKFKIDAPGRFMCLRGSQPQNEMLTRARR